MSGNKYRGEIILDLPSGAVTTVINSNALRLYMEAQGVDDINQALTQIDKNPIDGMPRLCYYGIKNHRLLTGLGGEMDLDWESFSAQVATLDFSTLLEEVSESLKIAEKKR